MRLQMAKVGKVFKFKYGLVQDGMVYYRRVVPLAIRQAHSLPKFVKKATGVKAANAFEAIAAITKLDALQEREWKQLARGVTGVSTLEKLLTILKDPAYHVMDPDQYEAMVDETSYYLAALKAKGQLTPELELMSRMTDFSNKATIPRTLSVCLSEYLSRHKNPSEGLTYDSTSSVNRFIKLHGDIAVHEITRDMVHAYVKDRLSGGLRTTTVRRELGQLGAIVNKAFLELELDKKSPFMSIDIPAENKDVKVKKPITSVKLDKLLATIRTSNTTSHLITKILLNTGMRIAELAVAKLEDVHLVDAKGTPLDIPFITVTPNAFRRLKTDESERSIPLVGISLEAANEAVRRADGAEYLFPRYGRKGGANNASAAVNASLEFVDINSHEFRHYITTRMREKMIPIDVRESVTGHRSKGFSESQNYGINYQLAQTYPELLKVAIQ
jgi:integrase